MTYFLLALHASDLRFVSVVLQNSEKDEPCNFQDFFKANTHVQNRFVSFLFINLEIQQQLCWCGGHFLSLATLGADNELDHSALYFP